MPFMFIYNIISAVLQTMMIIAFDFVAPLFSYMLYIYIYSAPHLRNKLQCSNKCKYEVLIKHKIVLHVE